MKMTTVFETIKCNDAVTKF